MAEYTVIFKEGFEKLSKSFTTLNSARAYAISTMESFRYKGLFHSAGIVKEGLLYGHVLPTNGIFFIWQETVTPTMRYGMARYKAPIWINNEGKSLTTAQRTFLSSTLAKNFEW